MTARRRESLARDLPAELQVAATNGSILTDSRGRKYIDFLMGWCVGNFGWRPAAIAIRTLQGAGLRLSRLLVCAVDGARAAARVARPASPDDMLPRDRWIRGGRPRAAG